MSCPTSLSELVSEIRAMIVTVIPLSLDAPQSPTRPADDLHLPEENLRPDHRSDPEPFSNSDSRFPTVACSRAVPAIKRSGKLEKRVNVEGRKEEGKAWKRGGTGGESRTRNIGEEGVKKPRNVHRGGKARREAPRENTRLMDEVGN